VSIFFLSGLCQNIALDRLCVCAWGGNFGKLLRALSQKKIGEFRGLMRAGRKFWQVITRAQAKKIWRIPRAGPSVRGDGILHSAKKN
jgi:hypothetical protein